MYACTLTVAQTAVCSASNRLLLIVPDSRRGNALTWFPPGMLLRNTGPGADVTVTGGEPLAITTTMWTKVHTP